MLQIEKEHKRSTLMSKQKKDLVDQIMRLEHNNNVLEDTINQQAENFKKIMEKLQTELKVKIDGIEVEYGVIPSGLISGWNGILYYFKTSNAYDQELHKKIVSKVIEQLESQSFDHWSEWRKTKTETVVWDEFCQITLVSFRIKDSY